MWLWQVLWILKLTKEDESSCWLLVWINVLILVTGSSWMSSIAEPNETVTLFPIPSDSDSLLVDVWTLNSWLEEFISFDKKRKRFEYFWKAFGFFLYRRAFYNPTWITTSKWNRKYISNNYYHLKLKIELYYFLNWIHNKLCHYPV